MSPSQLDLALGAAKAPTAQIDALGERKLVQASGLFLDVFVNLDLEERNDLGTVVKGDRDDVVTIDGSTGEVYLGTVDRRSATEDEDFQAVLKWADDLRQLKVGGGCVSGGKTWWWW